MEKSLKTNNKNIVDLKTVSTTKAQFNWEDPLLLDTLISEEESLIKIYKEQIIHGSFS